MAIGCSKHFCCGLEPWHHTGKMIPESTWAQVSQKVTDIKRWICKTITIKINDEHLVTVEEQLAGLKATVCWPVDIWLEHLQSSCKLVCQSQNLLCLCWIVACYQGCAFASSF